MLPSNKQHRSTPTAARTHGASIAGLLSRSTARRVTFARQSPAFDALLTETRGLCGVYIFEDGRHVLRVGKAVDLAARLEHHRNNAYRTYRGDFAHYHVFFKALVGRRLTIRWLECDSTALRQVERTLLIALDPLWENLMRQRRAGAPVDFASVRRLLGRH